MEDKQVREDCPWFREEKCRVDRRPCEPTYLCHKVLDKDWPVRISFLDAMYMEG